MSVQITGFAGPAQGRWLSWLLCFCLVLLASVAISCDLFDDDDDDDPPPPTCTNSPMFIADNPTPSMDSVSLQASSGSAGCGRVDVDVVITDTASIFTVEFTLTYGLVIGFVPRVRYQSFQEGLLLSKDGPVNSPTFIVVDASDALTEKVSVTASRFAPDPSIAAVGSEILLTLRFEVDPGVMFTVTLDPVAPSEVRDDMGAIVPVTFFQGELVGG